MDAKDLGSGTAVLLGFDRGDRFAQGKFRVGLEPLYHKVGEILCRAQYARNPDPMLGRRLGRLVPMEKAAREVAQQLKQSRERLRSGELDWATASRRKEPNRWRSLEKAAWPASRWSEGFRRYS